MNRTFTITSVYPMPNTDVVIYTGNDGNKYTTKDAVVKNLMTLGKEVTVNIKDTPSQKGNWSIINVMSTNGEQTSLSHGPTTASETPPTPSQSTNPEDGYNHRKASEVAGHLVAALITTKGVTDTVAVVKTYPVLYTMVLGCITGEITVEQSRIAEMMLPKVNN